MTNLQSVLYARQVNLSEPWKAYSENSMTVPIVRYAQQCGDAVETLYKAILEHHKQKADDRCVEDDDRLYAAAGLPKVDRRVGDKIAMLQNCINFINKRCEGGGPWETYAKILAERDALKAAIKEHHDGSTELDFQTLSDKLYELCGLPPGEWNEATDVETLWLEACKDKEALEAKVGKLESSLAEQIATTLKWREWHRADVTKVCSERDELKAAIQAGKAERVEARTLQRALDAANRTAQDAFDREAQLKSSLAASEKQVRDYARQLNNRESDLVIQLRNENNTIRHEKQHGTIKVVEQAREIERLTSEKANLQTLLSAERHANLTGEPGHYNMAKANLEHEVETYKTRMIQMDEFIANQKKEILVLRGTISLAEQSVDVHRKKWQDYEKDYILPCFSMAKTYGLDLHKRVQDCAGKNCVVLLVEWLWHCKKEADDRAAYETRRADADFNVAHNNTAELNRVQQLYDQAEIERKAALARAMQYAKASDDAKIELSHARTTIDEACKIHQKLNERNLGLSKKIAWAEHTGNEVDKLQNDYKHKCEMLKVTASERDKFIDLYQGYKEELSNLLAVIHGDGGHNEKLLGTPASTDKAKQHVQDLRTWCSALIDCGMGIVGGRIYEDNVKSAFACVTHLRNEHVKFRTALQKIIDYKGFCGEKTIAAEALK